MADISGFTHFMRLHALSASHARRIIVRLLDRLVKAAEPPLRIAEIEGDAVFFYAPARDADLADVAANVKAQLPVLLRTFRDEIEAFRTTPMCVCEACTTVGNLRLKQVVHAGEIAIERIDRFEKLFGLDVIVVHRMLKNTVPADEYLMLTEPAYDSFDGFYELEPERRTEQFEGVGAVPTVVFHSDQLSDLLARLPERETRGTTRMQVVGFNLSMLVRSVGEIVAGRVRRPA